MFVSNGGNNQTGWSNITYDNLIASAAKEADPIRDIVFFKKLKKILMEESPIMPIYTYTNTS